MSQALESFKKMLASGQQNALLHYSLGNEYLKIDDTASAIGHFQQALQLDENYSAAWKLLGKAYSLSENFIKSAEAFEQGIAVAEKRGDIQAAKEMRVFLKRARKNL